MTEAPNVTNQYSINVENNEKKYEITLSQKSNNLFIKSEEINSNMPLKIYEEEFSKCSLNQISKFFKIFDYISEVIPELKKRIEEKKIRLKVDEDTFQIFFNVEILNVNEFSLDLKNKEKNLKPIDENLYKTINELKEEKIKIYHKIEDLQNEIKIIKEKLLPLKEEKDKEEKEKQKEKLNFKGSKIIKNPEEAKILISNWIKPFSIIQFNLLYQASRDGDTTNKFEEKVKGKAPTLTLVKTRKGYKFGGYTTIFWEDSYHKGDESAFIFSLNKKKKYTLKSDKIENAISLSCHAFSFGVVVASDRTFKSDFTIWDKCFTAKSSSETPVSYNTTEKYELTGSQNVYYDSDHFIVDDCEVYEVKFL